ncbi:MAG TPA: glycosyltransferase family 87 protein [Candidatus Aquilonibacter sp.]|nr:glycosyltransferase family 87 protein [Candidatus Aquilonibacter sp.]
MTGARKILGSGASLPKVVKATLLVIFFACAVVMIGRRNFSFLQGTDFPHFYCASRILLDGQGGKLYDSALQYRYQAEYAGRVGTLYNHPPFEAALYLTVSWLPLSNAYLLWTFLNVLLLAIAARTLAETALPAWKWQMLMVATLTFVPLLLCLIQGQDSIMLLLLMTLAYAAFLREQHFSAGCWLALGLFKFQVVLPVILVLLLAPSGIRKRALASGFAAVALALMALSAVISGWSVFLTYPEFVLHLPAQRFAGIIPTAMANFRGLIYMLFHRAQPASAIAVLCLLSVAALMATLNDWRSVRVAPDLQPGQARDSFDLAFSATAIFSLLVSYHLNPHDLTLLLLPFSLTLHRLIAEKTPPMNASSLSPSFSRPLRWATFSLLAILFLPPLHLLALTAHLFAYAYLAIPLALLLAAVGFTLRTCKTPEIALHIDHC